MKTKLIFMMLLPFMLVGCDSAPVDSSVSLDPSVSIDPSSQIDTSNILASLSDQQAIASYIVENAKEWDNVFKNMFFTNYTMDVYYSMTYQENVMSVHNRIQVSDDAVIYQINVEQHEKDYYFVKGSTDWLAYSYNLTSEKYEQVTNEDFPSHQAGETIEATKNRMVKEASLYVTFENYYDKFVFDKEENEYYCSSIIICNLDDDIYPFDIAAKEVHVKFFEGDIISMSAKYVAVQDGQDAETVFAAEAAAGSSYRFEITNIGRTVVQEPTNIVKE